MSSKKSLRFSLKQLEEAGFVEYAPDKFAQKDRVLTRLEPTKKKRNPKGVRTGDTNDHRNKREKIDTFMKFVEQELGLEVWAEFHFAIDRQWRFDYCIPLHKIFIEVEGGVFTGGRHTRGKGFMNDMEKYNQASALGWRMIRRVPSDLMTTESIYLISSLVNIGQPAILSESNSLNL